MSEVPLYTLSPGRFRDSKRAAGSGERPYPEYSRANSYPWSPFPRGGPVQDPILTAARPLRKGRG